jgi:glycosyltransferase involved in cell wall biosynthesis
VKNLYLLFYLLEDAQLGKDNFLVPCYLGKIYGFDAHYVYPKTKTNKNFPSEIRGVKLVPVHNLFDRFKKRPISREFFFIVYIIFNAKKIDVLMRFLCSVPTGIIGVLYKILNPKGFLYVKSDGLFLLDRKYEAAFMTGKKIKQKLVAWLYAVFLKKIDLITIETKDGYDRLYHDIIYGVSLKDKTRLLPNGFDKDYFLQFGINKRTFLEKENIIITVGRLGTYQKNTEMLFDAIKRLYLKDWKIIFIGPIDKDFGKTIDAFYQTNSDLQNQVIFTGPLYDKNVLWEWYNKSKVFVLSSRWEGSAIVLSEAVFFRNYIVSTDVGGALDMIYARGGGVDGRCYGELVPQNDGENMTISLQKIIDGITDIETLYSNTDAGDITWEKYIRDEMDPIFLKNEVLNHA